MKILVIAPHPDDEVLGCGGTIAKHVSNGDEVHLCVVTSAYTPDWTPEFIKNRPLQIAKCQELLGISQVHLLDFPTVQLDTIPQKNLNDKISEVVGKTQADILYIPFKGDLNKDHRLIFESALVAARPLEHQVKKIFSYEILSETEWGQPLAVFAPNSYVDISNFLNKKLAAMRVYDTELKPFPHPRSLEAVEALAKKRGAEAGLKAAEAFMLIRETIS